ncbi:MAG: Uma2 family endonuclease [Bacteroidota bacterium]|nr:Uma2 family endonuclease [Bacteroidota bacterium]
MEAREPDMTFYGYSYADYLTWTMPDMVELIKGRVFRMNAAPKRIHQKISAIVCNKIYNFLEDKKCEVYDAPFDVRLPVHSKKNEDIFTVVQPDICVICDPEKLDDAGCIGAPDLIIEILSQGNNRKELQNKYEVYEERGVLEYWIISPDGQTLQVNTLIYGKYKASRLFTSGDIITTSVLPGFSLNLQDVFDHVNT